MTQEEFDEWHRLKEEQRYKDFDAWGLGYVMETGLFDDYFDEDKEALPWDERLLANIKREPLHFAVMSTIIVGALMVVTK